MIDTIKLAYPLDIDDELFKLLNSRSERLQKLSPDGEILWEKSVVRGDCMPSHYSGLRITTRRKKDLLEAGFQVKEGVRDLAFFEFSLQKYQSPSAYNNKNTELETDIEALKGWVNTLSTVLNYPFDIDEFKLYMVHLSQNFLIMNASPIDYLRSTELSFSRHPDSDGKMAREGHSIALRSVWIGKKIYYKGKEFQDVERKKHKHLYTDRYCDGQVTGNSQGVVPLTPEEINDLLRMIRFEIEFKCKYLERSEVKKIMDIPILLNRFEEEKKKYLIRELLEKGEPCLSAQQERAVTFVRRFGVKEAKIRFIEQNSERTWYRIKRELASKSIYLEALDNIEFRLEGRDIFHNPEALDFQLVLAPFQEEALREAA